MHVSGFKMCEIHQGCSQAKLGILTFSMLCSLSDCKAYCNEIKINVVWLHESFKMLLYALKSAKSILCKTTSFLTVYLLMYFRCFFINFIWLQFWSVITRKIINVLLILLVIALLLFCNIFCLQIYFFKKLCYRCVFFILEEKIYLS